MNKNKIINWVFLILLFSSLSFGVYRFFISRNFLVVFHSKCDPTVENCFVGRCDEIFNKCTGNKEKDVWYYSKVKKMAYDVQKCDSQAEKCPDESICDQPISQHCWIEKCSEETLGEDEECSYPEIYLKEHPEALEKEEEAVKEESFFDQVFTENVENTSNEHPNNENIFKENLNTVNENSSVSQEISPTSTVAPVSEPTIPSMSSSPNVVPY